MTLLAFDSEVSGQQIGVTTPFTTVSDSYYENHGVNFGFALPGGRGPGSRVVGWGPGGFTNNLNFRQGGAASAIPAFGGYDPNSAARFGFGRRGSGGGGFGIGFTLGKGSSRTITSTAPSITVPNGFGGVISSGINRPFVTSYRPVVGQGPPPIDNAVTRAIQSGQLDLSNLGQGDREPVYRSASYEPTSDSSAKYGDESVAAIKARRQAAESTRERRFQKLVASGLELEEQGKYLDARRHYRKSLLEFDDKDKKDWFRQRVRMIRDR